SSTVSVSTNLHSFLHDALPILRRSNHADWGGRISTLRSAEPFQRLSPGHRSRRMDSAAAGGFLSRPRTRRPHKYFGHCDRSESRSEEHTSDLQSRVALVCRLVL